LKLRHLLFGLGAASVGVFVYGMLVETWKLKLEQRTLRLPLWPERLAGFRIAVLADFHLRDEYSLELAKRAVEMALDESPDMVVIPGDIVGHWRENTAALVGEALEPLLLMNGNVVAIPGNHEYWNGTPELIAPILDELNIRLLVNQAWRHAGITWVGIDSANLGRPNPEGAMRAALNEEPIVALWHEPDLVGGLPAGAALMIAGHSHGGQFRTPWGWPPMTTVNGKSYRDGFFPDTPTPLYVSRGIGTTGPPTRLFCPPEVSLLTLEPA
jgi:predicted MPP superfamily phosphohydrolase